MGHPESSAVNNRDLLDRIRRRGPESAAWDAMKGQRVKVYWANSHDEYVWHGKLVWVDRYSIGLEIDDIDEGPTQLLMHRGPGLVVRLAP